MQKTSGVYMTQEGAQFTEPLLWDPVKKEFLGRTFLSWGKICGFYFIFYICLLAFFFAYLGIFYQTIDTENNPKYAPGDGGSALQNPVLGYRPMPPRKDIESTLIWYKNADYKDISHWVNQLTEFIGPYEGQHDDGENIRQCDFETYLKEKEELETGRIQQRDRRACSFKDTWLSQAGGYCDKSKHWGYDRESPCIVLKMNRMIGWVPDVYKNETELPREMPPTLKEIIANETRAKGYLPPMVWVSCQGENAPDFEYLPDVHYYPQAGFPAYYFPYHKNPAYRSPLVAVHFIKPHSNVLINIECRLWAKNIIQSRQDKLGLIHFELLRD